MSFIHDIENRDVLPKFLMENDISILGFCTLSWREQKKARAVTISDVLLFSALRKTNPVSVYTDKITFAA